MNTHKYVYVYTPFMEERKRGKQGEMEGRREERIKERKQGRKKNRFKALINCLALGPSSGVTALTCCCPGGGVLFFVPIWCISDTLTDVIVITEYIVNGP